MELIDIFPTLNDLLGIPHNRKHLYGTQKIKFDPKSRNAYPRKFIPLQGKSLAPLILGNKFTFRAGKTNSKIIYNGNLMPTLNHTFALSQTWRCAETIKALKDPRQKSNTPKDLRQWDACNIDTVNIWNQTSVMGYSMRTLAFRYTMYIHFLLPYQLPEWDKPIFAEELYDHRGDTASDLGHKELVNLASNPEFAKTVENYRNELRAYLWKDVLYLNLTMTFNEMSYYDTAKREIKKIIKPKLN